MIPPHAVQEETPAPRFAVDEWNQALAHLMDFRYFTDVPSFTKRRREGGLSHDHFSIPVPSKKLVALVPIKSKTGVEIDEGEVFVPDEPDQFVSHGLARYATVEDIKMCRHKLSNKSMSRNTFEDK